MVGLETQPPSAPAVSNMQRGEGFVWGMVYMKKGKMRLISGQQILLENVAKVCHSRNKNFNYGPK